MKEYNNITQSGTLLDGRYKLLRPLSSDGGTADVWLALDTNTIDEVYDEDNDSVSSEEESGIKVAIKIYRPKNALDLGEQRFREEFKIVFNCHHTNLVQPINFSIFEGTPYLVLPYCRKGSSENLRGKIEDSEELWRYIADVASGLAYLHAFNPTIVHHDIKPANILIDENDNYAITDFGISSQRGSNREGYDYNQSGTMAYMAPERFKEDYKSIPESDIWSFGATIYELITGKVPFGEDGGLTQLEKNEPVPHIDKSIPNDIKRLIYDCLSSDPSKRPSASIIHKAAEEKKYPRDNKKILVSAVIAVIAASAIFTIFLSPDKTGPSADESTSIEIPEEVTLEQRYEKAMELVNSVNPDSLSLGLSMLDSIGASGYVPALYEQAFTYGWYSDSASVSRKRLLGIEIFPKNSIEEFLPKSIQVNNKAIGLFSRIEELDNPEYPYINANALYRLALYSFNPNNIFKKDEKRAEDLLNRALIYAEQCDDEKTIKRIQNGLSQIHK